MPRSVHYDVDKNAIVMMGGTEKDPLTTKDLYAFYKENPHLYGACLQVGSDDFPTVFRIQQIWFDLVGRHLKGLFNAFNK